MVDEAAPKLPYVFDSSSLINLERSSRLRGVEWLEGLQNGWLIVPSRVVREVTRKKNSPLYRLFANERGSSFVAEQEHRLYYELITRGDLGDGEAAAIAIAHRRGGTVVTDDKAAQREAERLQVRSITWTGFLGEASPRPRLRGF